MLKICPVEAYKNSDVISGQILSLSARKSGEDVLLQPIL